MSSIIGINNFLNKKTGLILPAPKISILPTSQNIEKEHAHSSDKHQCAKFLDNPIDAPRIPFLGLKFSFPIHKFQTWKPAQKVLNTDIRDSRSRTEILIFNHHLSGPLKSYYEFVFTKTYLR